MLSHSVVTPGTEAHQAPLSMGILQVRILEWVAMPSSRGPHGYWHCSVFPSSVLNSPFIQFLALTTDSQEAILLCILSTRLPQEKVTDSTALECLGMTCNGAVLIKSKYRNQQMTLQLPPDNQEGCFPLCCSLSTVKRTSGKLLLEFSTRKKSVWLMNQLDHNS